MVEAAFGVVAVIWILPPRRDFCLAAGVWAEREPISSRLCRLWFLVWPTSFQSFVLSSAAGLPWSSSARRRPPSQRTLV